MSEYFYITCEEKKVSIRLGQGIGAMHLPYKDSQPALVHFLNYCLYEELRFVSDIDWNHPDDMKVWNQGWTTGARGDDCDPPDDWGEPA